MMMGFACSLCVLGAAVITYIISNLADLSSIRAFLLSWGAVMLIAAGLKLKESSVRGTGAFRMTKIVGSFCAILVLYPAAQAFPEAWRQAAGLGSKAFLVWLALLSLMLISVIVQMGEEPRDTAPLPPA